jgi:hypothetical protein
MHDRFDVPCACIYYFTDQATSIKLAVIVLYFSATARGCR